MRVAIATVQVPFIWGGAEYLAAELQKALERAGHRAETVTIPFKWYPPERIPEHILAARLFDLTESCGIRVDLLIGLKFPAYCFHHPRKVLWILHQHRQAYDLWGTEYSDLHLSPQGDQVREAIFKADNQYLREAVRVFTISRNVSARLQRHNGITSTPLYHPCPHAEEFSCEAFEPYAFFPSRLDQMKRQHLVIEAMRHVKTPLKLCLAGSAATPMYLEQLQDLICRYRLEERVKIMHRVTEEEKRALYARCRAVVFPPYDEDYGYVTLEASYASKALITCRDSGGPLEFAHDRDTGMVCDPTPEGLAEAMDYLGESEERAREMGKRAREAILAMGLSWERVVKELTAL
ncbi:MAG: glycosyltransferase family 4 protein [Firmicutes bacterium]|nr:glycosyltransferase family 4 protein [Bacillota bacterium]